MQESDDFWESNTFHGEDKGVAPATLTYIFRLVLLKTEYVSSVFFRRS